MKNWNIYFDLDGVLADFERGVTELCGVQPCDQEVDDPEAEERMWAGIKKADHFYDRLEYMPGAERLFRLLNENPNCHCEILTGIPKKRRGIVTASEDKMDWVRRKLSKDIPVNIVYKEQKKNFCTGKNCVLIDDYSRNVKEWEAAGGTGIWFTDADDVINTLKEIGVVTSEVS